MISLAPGTKVYLACRPVDMRKGFNGLSAIVSEVIRMDPYAGHVFVFRGKRGDCVKILHWDGSGLCLYAKRLESGRFVWPPGVDERMSLSAAQLALLIEGMVAANGGDGGAEETGDRLKIIGFCAKKRWHLRRRYNSKNHVFCHCTIAGKY